MSRQSFTSLSPRSNFDLPTRVYVAIVFIDQTFVAIQIDHDFRSPRSLSNISFEKGERFQARSCNVSDEDEMDGLKRKGKINFVKFSSNTEIRSLIKEAIHGGFNVGRG